MQPLRQIKYIAVDGPIGAGKTTLATLLAEDMGAYPCLEAYKNNPFLPEFYSDKKKNAFKTQLFFLLNRYQQQLELKQHDLFRQTVVSDYTFEKDAIFAKINLSEDEQYLYNTVYHLLQERLPRPDLVIYVRADRDVLMKRIKERGVEYEQSISEEYIDRLADEYNRHFLDYDWTPLLVVDTSNQNYLENAGDLENIKKAIMNHRGGTVHLIAR